MTEQQGRVSSWLPVVVIAAAIFWGSSRTVTLSVGGGTAIALAVGFHMTEFGLLAVAIRRALILEGIADLVASRVAWIASFGYAISDEIHQQFTPGRNASALDLIPDGVGALVALSLTGAWQRRKRSAAARQAR